MFKSKSKIVEFIGLPGVGKSHLVNLSASKMDEMGVRPWLRGKSFPYKNKILLIAIQSPVVMAKILFITVVYFLIVEGPVSNRLARCKQLFLGLFKMICALKFDVKLMLDEGPLVWIAAVATKREYLRKCVFMHTVIFYKWANCSVVDMSADSATLTSNREKRSAEKSVLNSKSSSEMLSSSIKKQTDAGRELSLAQIRFYLHDNNVRVLSLSAGDPNGIDKVVKFCGW